MHQKGIRPGQQRIDGIQGRPFVTPAKSKDIMIDKNELAKGGEIHSSTIAFPAADSGNSGIFLLLDDADQLFQLF